eukprot:11483085-Alexandrium_andersonii.AAC.1
MVTDRPAESSARKRPRKGRARQRQTGHPAVLELDQLGRGHWEAPARARATRALLPFAERLGLPGSPRRHGRPSPTEGRGRRGCKGGAAMGAAPSAG